MSNKQRNDRSGNSRSGSKSNLKDRPVVKDKMADGGQRTKEIVNVNSESDSDSLLREMDSDTDGIGTHNSTKDTERHNQRKQKDREREREIQATRKT